MNAFDQYEVWFVTGAQLLYGGDAVVAVDAHSNEMVKGLNDFQRSNCRFQSCQQR